MSERKTAEIKFRCTPSFKASVQAAAQAAEQSMSEYIEAAVQEKEWARMNQTFDGLALINNAIKTLDPESEQALALEHSVPTITEGTVVANGPVTLGDIVHDVQTGEIVRVIALADEGRVPVACACRPWEFCTHKASA